MDMINIHRCHKIFLEQSNGQTLAFHENKELEKAVAVLQPLFARLAVQGFAGHLIQFEAGSAPPRAIPYIFVTAKHRFRFFDKLKAVAVLQPLFYYIYYIYVP